jgi:hypothetical protein
VYEHADFGGWAFFADKNYGFVNLAANGKNDEATSIKVTGPSGCDSCCSATIFQHDDGTGWSATYYPSNSGLIADVYPGLDDDATTFQVFCSGTPGCDGVLESGLTVDVCGVCGGDGQSCLGCDGVPNSGKIVDDCGVCGGLSESCMIGGEVVPRKSRSFRMVDADTLARCNTCGCTEVGLDRLAWRGHRMEDDEQYWFATREPVSIGTADGTLTVSDVMILFTGNDGTELEYLWPCCSDKCDCDPKEQSRQARHMMDRDRKGSK